MNFTLGTLCSNILWTSVLLVAFTFFFHKPVKASKLDIYVPIVSCAIVAARLLLPFEWGFTRTIPIAGIHSHFAGAAHQALFYIDTAEITSIVILYALSALGFIVLLVRLHIAQKMYARYAKALATESIQQYTNRFGRTHSIRCVVDPNSTGAIAFGLFSPTIVMPGLPLSAKDRRLIICHEMQHIKNGDLWIKLAIEIVCLLYWWNPLIKLLRNRMDVSLESRVDNDVMALLNEEDKVSYLECILNMSKQDNVTGTTPSLAAGFISRKGVSLRSRFDSMLNENQSRVLSRLFVMVMLIVTLGTTFVVLEPSSTPDDVRKESYGASDFDDAYLVKLSENDYMLYMDGAPIGSLTDPSMLPPMKIYKRMEEIN